MAFLPQGWTIERVVLVVTFLLSAMAFVFGIGANWARLSEQDKRQELFERYTNETFVRGDVYQVQQQRLVESIDRLNRNLERIETMQYQPDTRVRPVVPQFGRQ